MLVTRGNRRRDGEVAASALTDEGQPIYAADRSHFHHRFLDIGFSQRRAALTIWAWVAILAAAALATRFVPFREHGVWHTGPTVAVGLIGLAALAASVYMVYLLEIVKLANPYIKRRVAEQRRQDESAEETRHSA